MIRSVGAMVLVAAPVAGCGADEPTKPSFGGGRPLRLSGLTGTPTVISLWASWCKRFGDRVRFMGIDTADAAPDQETGVRYPQLVDRAGRTCAPLRYSGLPPTVFVDEQGRMVFTERKPFRSYADVTSAIREHLGVTS